MHNHAPSLLCATLACVGLVFAASAAQAAGGGCSVAMLPLEIQGLNKLEAHIPVLLVETMSHEIADSTACVVVNERDIRALIELEERQQDCGSDTASCLSEVGDALGVDFVISGTLGKLGNIYSLNMRIIDTEIAQVIARSQRAVTNDATLLRRAARDMARELFRLEPLSEEQLNDVVEGATLVNGILFWGGLSGLAVSTISALTGIISSVGLVYFISFDRTPALAPFKPLAQDVFFYPAALTFGALVIGALSTLMFGVSFAVE